MANVAKFGGTDVANLAKIMGLDVPGAGTLASDVIGFDHEPGQPASWVPVGAGLDVEIAAKTLNFDADSIAVATGSSAGNGSGTPDHLKLRLYMGGVQVNEGGWISNVAAGTVSIVMGFRALSGSQACSIEVHNYHGSSVNYTKVGAGCSIGSGIGVGSVKLT